MKAGSLWILFLNSFRDASCPSERLKYRDKFGFILCFSVLDPMQRSASLCANISRRWIAIVSRNKISLRKKPDSAGRPQRLQSRGLLQVRRGRRRSGLGEDISPRRSHGHFLRNMARGDGQMDSNNILKKLCFAPEIRLFFFENQI